MLIKLNSLKLFLTRDMSGFSFLKLILGRGWQRQRLRSLGEKLAGAKTALPRGEAGRGKDCAPSGRGWQGQRLLYYVL